MKKGLKTVNRLLIVKKLKSIVKYGMFYSQKVDINKGEQNVKLGGGSLNF